MKVSIVPPDRVISIDGQSVQLDSLARLDRFHAIHWDGTKGHVEYIQPDGEFFPNETILTIEPFRRYINEALELMGTPAQPALMPLTMFAYKMRLQIAFTLAKTTDFGVQYSDPQSIGMLTALVALFDKGLLTGKINYKGPNGFISLDGAEMLQLAGQIAQHVQKAFNAEKAILENIEMGTITTHDQIVRAFAAAMQ